MSNFIEELYYGNIDPQARSTKQNKTVSKQMEILMANETFLTETLTDECKKKFLDYVDAWGVVNCESNLDSFITGFRLGGIPLGRKLYIRYFCINRSPVYGFNRGVKIC